MDGHPEGVGTDIESVDRFRALDRVTHQRFFERVYTNAEIAYCFAKIDPAPHLAARWCAKEAVVKALSSIGIERIAYCDIAVTSGSDGVPRVHVSDIDPSVRVHVSLSHSRDNATAFAIAYYDEREEATAHRAARELHRETHRGCARSRVS
ncbi:MAG: holo-ACP synthase [bacterium]|nr:holo-ACP synthase [bacterium]